MAKLNGCTFLLKMMTYWKNIILFGIKSALILKKNFIGHLSTMKKSYGDDAIDFHDKKIPKMSSNHTCLTVISLDSDVNKDGNCYPQVF